MTRPNKNVAGPSENARSHQSTACHVRLRSGVVRPWAMLSI
jgi:hypothetical protein